MADLTEAQLRALDALASSLCDDGDEYITDAVAEIRRRRAADLSAEDLESLRWIREATLLDHRIAVAMNPNGNTVARARRAIALLDRLIAAAKGG